MAIEKLTALKVRSAKPGMHGDGRGLWLYVGSGNQRSWAYRYTLAGRAHEMGLGSAADITPAEARELARECRRLCAAGVDPIENRRAKRAAAGINAAKAMTFKAAAEAYIKAHRSGWRNVQHAGQWTKTLSDFAFPIFGDLPVAAVDVGLVMRVLEPLWSRTPETASRLRGRIESVLDWAAARDYRTGENPARWRGHLENLLPRKSKVRQVVHHPAIPYDQVPAFVIELRRQGDISARGLELMILTASRSREVTGAQWAEIDFDKKIWTVPGARMKSGMEHHVPLSDRAMEIIREMQSIRQHEFVFPGRKSGQPMSGGAMLALLHRLGRSETVHGFRASFRSWTAARTNFPREVCEAALAHVIENRVEAAYQRESMIEKRRALMDAWAKFCGTPAPASVVPIGRRAG